MIPLCYAEAVKRETVYNLLTWEAYLAGIFAFAYACAFVLARNPFWSAVFLLLTGLFAVKVMAILYRQLRDREETLALIALLFGVAGSFGALIHGGYDLATLLAPPANLLTDVVSQVDPRGLLTFGLTGIGVAMFSWLMGEQKGFPVWLQRWGYLSAALLVIIYLARLIIVSPAHPLLLYPVLVEGFVVGPVWYLWIGRLLQQKKI